jgi:hypothetical protein
MQTAFARSLDPRPVPPARPWRSLRTAGFTCQQLIRILECTYVYRVSVAITPRKLNTTTRNSALQTPQESDAQTLRGEYTRPWTSTHMEYTHTVDGLRTHSSMIVPPQTCFPPNARLEKSTLITSLGQKPPTASQPPLNATPYSCLPPWRSATAAEAGLANCFRSSARCDGRAANQVTLQ